MSKITITSPHAQTTIDFTPTKEFLDCLLPAIIAAAPAFLQAFMQCLAPAETPPGYNPGDRRRCDAP